MEDIEMKQKSKLDLVLNIFIILIAICEFFPLYWLITSSFKKSNIITVLPPEWFPQNPILDNYRLLFNGNNTLRWIFNSVLIAAVTTVLIVFVSTLASYAFAKLHFPGDKFFFMLFLFTLMLPKEIFVVPLFRTTQMMGIAGTYTGVILPNVALSFGIYLLRQFFDTIPDSLRDAAKVDGASEVYIFARIYVPLATAGISALVILMFIQTWNDFLWQLVQLTEDEMKTIQLGVATFQNESYPNYGVAMAGACIAAAPLIIIFLLFQKYFTQGITMGAVKE